MRYKGYWNDRLKLMLFWKVPLKWVLDKNKLNLKSGWTYFKVIFHNMVIIKQIHLSYFRFNVMLVLDKIKARPCLARLSTHHRFVILHNLTVVFLLSLHFSFDTQILPNLQREKSLRCEFSREWNPRVIPDKLNSLFVYYICVIYSIMK